MMGVFKKGERWQLAGISCANHLGEFAKLYGTVKIMTLDPETVDTDTRCNITNCIGHVGYVVEK